MTGSTRILGSVVVTGSTSITGSLTVVGDINARSIIVQTVTSSIIYSSGSNVFGDALGDNHIFTGSVFVSRSLSVTGSLSTTGSVTFRNLPNSSSNRYLVIDDFGQVFFRTGVSGSAGFQVHNPAIGRVILADNTSTGATASIFLNYNNNNFKITGSVDISGSGARSAFTLVRAVNQASIYGNNDLVLETDSNFYIGAYTARPLSINSANGAPGTVYVASDGKTGFGTTSPSAKVEIKASTANNLGGLLLRATGSSTNVPAVLYENSSNGGTLDLANSANTVTARLSSNSDSYINGGSLGIGVTSPQAPLHVIAANSSDNALFQEWSYTAGNTDTYSLMLKQTVTAGVVRYNFSMVNDSTAYNNVLVLDRGSVGIGTATPGHTLDVFGNVASEAGLRNDINTRVKAGFWQANSSSIDGGWPVGTGTWYHLITSTHSNTANYYSLQIAGDFFSQDFYIRSTGDSGTRAWSRMLLGTGTTNFVSKFTAGNILGNSQIFDNGTNVGINNTSPQNKLDVYVPSGIAASFGGQFSVGQFSGINFGYLETANTNYRKSALVFERTDNNGQGANASGKIHFLLNNNSSTSATSLSDSVVTIDSDAFATVGSVRFGIGTTNPSASLQVGPSTSDTGTQTVRIATNYSANTVVDALHIDHIGGAGAWTDGVAISLGHKSTTYNSFTSRIVSYLNLSVTQATKLQLQTQAGGGTVWNTGIVIDGDGRTGINTTTPAYTLDVNGIIGLGGFPFAENGSHYNTIKEPAGNNALILGNATDPTNYYDNTTHHFRARAGVTTYAFLNSTGLGIFASPNTALDVAGGINSRNSRVSLARKFPIGHYTPGETVFEIDSIWSTAQLQDYMGSTAFTWVQDSTAPGGYCIQVDGAVNVGNVAYSSGFPFIPTDTGSADWYYMECWIKNEAGSSINHYMGGIDYDHNFSSLGGNPGSFTYNVMLNYDPGTEWTKVFGYWNGFGDTAGGAGTGNVNNWEVGTKYFGPQALFNYTVNSGTSRCYISGWKIIRVSQQGNRYFQNNVLVSQNVGIGTTSPSFPLHVAGKIYSTGDIQGLGTGYFGGDVIAYYSDQRLKTNIRPIESALDKISKLGGYYYQPNELALQLKAAKDEKQKLGLIAQEVQKVFPEAIERAPFDMDEKGGSKSGEEYLTVKYERLIPVLLEAVKELYELIKNK